MSWTCEQRFLDGPDIRVRWEILNPLLGHINSERLEYKIWSGTTGQNSRSAVFYLHGLGGTLDDCPYIEDYICSHVPLVRVACYGLSEGFWNLPKVVASTFGDICAILRNGRQAIYSIADILELDSYSIVAHSWGGFIACLAALGDTRCSKAMLLTSTPDICDALCRMDELSWITIPWIHYEAEKAKFGNSRYQLAWDAISPYGEANNPGLEMLILNREEDLVMRRWNVEHFVSYARDKGIPNVKAEFNKYPELSNWHDMPPEKFRKRMEKFLFEKV